MKSHLMLELSLVQSGKSHLITSKKTFFQEESLTWLTVMPTSLYDNVTFVNSSSVNYKNL